LHQRLDPTRILKPALQNLTILDKTWLHQRLDPTRILKRTIGAKLVGELAGLHQRLDPTRILKLVHLRLVLRMLHSCTRGSIRRGY